MLYNERKIVPRRWRRQLFLLCILLALAVSANATTLDKRSTRGQRQELSLEERLEAEQRLSSLGYWTGPVDGDFDVSSRHALIAFQKVEGRQRTGKLTKDELQAMRMATRPLP